MNCPKCKKHMTEVKDMEQLITIPWDWYTTSKLMDKYYVFQCLDCGILYRNLRLAPLLDIEFRRVLTAIKVSLKWICRKIMEAITR